MNTLTETAPTEIHLCISDDPETENEPFPDYQGDIGWADHAATTTTIRYIREDVAHAAIRERRSDPYCESKAYQSEIKRLHQALLDAAEALESAANDIAYYGASPHLCGWEEDEDDARSAATKARSTAMSGVQPA